MEVVGPTPEQRDSIVFVENNPNSCLVVAFDGSDLGLNWFKTRLNLTNSHKAINEQTLFSQIRKFSKASFNNPHFQLRVVLFLKEMAPFFS